MIGGCVYIPSGPEWHVFLIKINQAEAKEM